MDLWKCPTRVIISRETAPDSFWPHLKISTLVGVWRGATPEAAWLQGSLETGKVHQRIPTLLCAYSKPYINIRLINASSI